ncbi:MAG: FtsX-like permease family protein [Anaerolineaceae bacterium]|nr:FtsX-like permease family protein [Anaerolineaceae bacterium]MCB9099711.1 FtsX-like permease family protein [Anaerolineales bacterium]
MNVIWYKVWSDIWDNKVRTMLAVLSISAGVFAIGAVFGMVDQLITGMDRAHQAVVPSHLFMAIDPRIDETTADRLAKVKGIEDIEVANEVAVRYKIHPDDDWRAARLIMRKDYEDQTYDILQLKEGEWPKKDNFGIERLSSQTFGINIGDKVIFELDKSDRALPITGKIRHNFVEPPDFGGDAVFFTDAQGLERFNIPEGEYNNLFIRVTPYSADFAREMATEIKDRLAKEDVGVNFTSYQDPEEHWGRRFVEGINLVLQILAIISLAMSVILVTNTMTALITQQTNQIGMIKAVGGTTGAILKIYLAAVLIYGSLAFIISLPFGAMVAYGISKWFLNLFNIDYEVFQISTRAVIYQAIAATLIPLLAALWPVLTGAAITVREAIASYGLGGDFGSSRLDQGVERIGQRFLSSPYAIALGNLFRRKGRLTLTQLVLVGAGTMFLIVMSLSASISYTLNTDMNRRGFDVRIGFRDPQRTDRVETMAHKVPGVDQAETWFTTPAAILKEGQSTQEAGVGAELIGIPEGSEMYQPLIVAGRWLEPGDDRVIVMSRDTAEDNNISVGDTVTLNLFELGDDEWQVVGLFQVIFSGGFDAEPIYAPEDAVFHATKKYNDGVRLFVSTVSHTPQDVESIYQQLKDDYEDRNMDIDVFSTGTTPDDMANAISQFSITTNMLMGLAVIVAMVGGIGLMGSLSISVVERTREIGVMRAIGARSMTIMGMFVMEGVLQGVFSWLVSVPISFILARPLANALGQAMFDANLDYKYNFGAVIVWLIVILIISTLASILPARSATTISVRDSLAYA